MFFPFTTTTRPYETKEYPTMTLINAAHTPPLAISPDATVAEACSRMAERNVGAIVIISPDLRPIGIFTERDVVQRIIVPGLDPHTTAVREVMTSPCLAIPADRTADDALHVLLGKTAFHLAVIDEERKLVGVVSYRTLLSQQIENLNAEVDHLSAYMGYDGGGD
jgi:CBS domain-containing protein